MAKTINTAIMVGELTNKATETPDGIMATLMTREVSHGGRAYEAFNFIECTYTDLIDRLSGCLPGDCLAVTGKLQTKNKITRIMVETLERCVSQPHPKK